MNIHRLFLAVLMVAGSAFVPLRALEPVAKNPVQWEPRIARYLEKDKANPPPHGGIVFTGSSSIEMWLSLARDFPDLPVIRRGIGGTWLAELPQFAPQLVYPLQPRLIVVYAGENDLQCGHSVDDVVRAFTAVRAQIRAAAPQAPMVFLAIKPSPSRRALLPAMREANQRIAALCAQDAGCTFIDVFTPMLTPDGEPRPELFSADLLHMNAAGYRLWTQLVTPVLAAFEQRRPRA